MPGSQPREAAALVLDVLSDLPHLPELPQRGPWATPPGRAVALLSGLSGGIVISGWRLTSRAGRDARRAAALLAEDLDAIEERADGFAGILKVQVRGPVTLSTELELASGHAAATDEGARRDLGQSLAEGLSLHVAELRRRLPSATLLVQLDEPALPICLAGELPTASGFARVRALPAEEARRTLSGCLTAVHDACAHSVVHCAVPTPPVSLIVEAGANAMSLDVAAVLGSPEAASLDEPIGHALEAGVGLFAGVIPTTDPLSDLRSSVDLVRSATSRWGLPPDRVSRQVVVTPVGDLAAGTPENVTAVYRAAVKAAAQLRDDPEASA